MGPKELTVTHVVHCDECGQNGKPVLECLIQPGQKFILLGRIILHPECYHSDPNRFLQMHRGTSPPPA